VSLKASETTTNGHRRARPALLCALAMPLLILAGRAQASADCTVTAGGVAFGVYDQVATTPDDSTGTVTVTCVNTGPANTTVNYSVALSTGASGAYSQRYMTAGTPRLDYNLYRDAARTIVWGDGTGGSSLIAGTLTVGPGQGNGTKSAAYTVYGRAPALQDAAPGTYADTIVVTLTF
jgi:spore coat protein U-like protein